MQLLGAIGGLSFVAASFVVGLRLLWLAHRTRELPEFTIGLALVLMGALGYPLTAIARMTPGLSDELRIMLFVVSLVLTWGGTVLLALFNLSVFRPDEAWARALVVGVATWLLATFSLQSFSPGLRVATFRNEGLGLRLFMCGIALPLAWGTYESLRYWGLLRKRARLGLADPVVADRMRLWGIAELSAMVINVSTTVGALFGVDFAVTALGALVIAPLGLLAAGATWFAFLPPAAYLRRVVARAAAGEV
ncbi:MAG TPA: hypothetical protein VEG67_04585 [Myxococcota bacterium]|nr:hypothetical protein [Myxococcota bacterium]